MCSCQVEEKVGILITGLVQRDAKLRKQAEEAWEQVHQAATELECFKVCDWEVASACMLALHT